MKNAEDPIFDDEETGSQSVESSALSNADQNHSQDLNLNELYSMLGESSSLENDQTEVEISMMSETTSDEAVNDDSSVLDELEAMYSGLDSSNEENDGLSVMDELEVMHDNSDVSIINDAENVSKNDDESDSASVSIMEELEAMYGSFSKSSTNDESSSINNHEPVAESVSALTELEALLGDSIESADDIESSEVFSNSNYEHLFENQDSVLDELQNLLQKSIEELDASADDHSMDAKYPSRNELKTLLEDKLSQLMISDGSESFSFDEGGSMLDGLNALMKETGSDISASDSYLSSTQSDDLSGDVDASISDEIDEYISSISSSYEDTPGDEFESLLSGTAETMESEVAQDVSSISTVDEKTDSDLAQEPDVASVSAESDSALNVLEQLEEMMAETTEPENDEISDDIKTVESDFVIKHELSDLSGKAKEEAPDEIKVEAISELNEKEQAADAHKSRLIQQSLRKEIYLLDKTENNKLLSLWGVLLITAVVVGVLVLWNLFGQGNEQFELAENVVPPVSQPLSEKIATSEFSEKSDDIAEVDNIHDLLASLETSRYETKPSYDYESYEKLDQPYVDESLNNGESVSSVETDVSQMEQSVQSIAAVTSELSAEPVLQEPIVEDVIAKAQNIWSINLMSYYNKPPRASELEFLKVAGIPYKVEKVIVNGEDWYRVLVSKSSEYRVAKEYAETLKKRLGIKKIWISKNQDVDD